MATLLHRPLLLGVLAFTASLSLAMADTAKKDHDHSHDHSHSHDEAKSQIYKGYFEDSQIGDRALSDWEGDWQSVYPLLKDGTLDPVMAEKAAHGDKSAAEYKAYYETGYATETDRITITGDQITFQTAEGAATGTYAADGYEILSYEKGNRGVRFIFRKTAGDAQAPGFIQFSDHIIAPEKSGHFHLYFGDDRAELLKELTNWPTYYPAGLSGAEIVSEMNAH
ncbi:metal-binding protein ZinT [Pseudomonas sp. GX19020]|uniref:ZinT family metal-binding protein n=1 Tax=Pseudomonas sp. GX19020 TaxID=2942277 RepID=UPI0020191C0C|nr:metal-binding protein ZinT [Pseudomonas sp. GX19020]MCL4066759.1 metal-binding protein ZinT [Pseudomonas sp. GX19020]